MEFEQIKEKVLPILRKHYLPLGLGALGLILIGYGLISSFSPKSNEAESIKPAQTVGSSIVIQKKIMVDVEGAVVNPGVYELSSDARMKDALIAAGGLNASADRAWVAKNLNLAAMLTDGAKIYVRGLDEGVSNAALESSTASNSELININDASSSQLDSLSGIGPATAQKIINGRPYGSIDELTSKKIVSQKVFDSIKDKISAY